MKCKSFVTDKTSAPKNTSLLSDYSCAIYEEQMGKIVMDFRAEICIMPILCLFNKGRRKTQERHRCWNHEQKECCGNSVGQAASRAIFGSGPLFRHWIRGSKLENSIGGRMSGK